MRTETIYLGPVHGGVRRKGVLSRIGGLIEANLTRRHGLPEDETMLRQYNQKVERDQQARDKMLNDLHARFCLKMSSGQDQPLAPGQQKAPSEEGANALSTPMPAST